MGLHNLSTVGLQAAQQRSDSFNSCCRLVDLSIGLGVSMCRIKK